MGRRRPAGWPGSGNWGEGAPKTRKSRRRIDLSELAREALTEQRAASRLRSAYVFPNAEGGPLDRHNFTQRNWRRILTRAGVRPRPFEQLRHTWATLMLSDPETDLRYVADQMGHRNLEMLLKHYVRWMPGRVAAAAGGALDTFVDGAAYFALAGEAAGRAAGCGEPQRNA